MEAILDVPAEGIRNSSSATFHLAVRTEINCCGTSFRKVVAHWQLSIGRR